MRFTSASPVDVPSRPRGVRLTASAMCGFVLIAYMDVFSGFSGRNLVGLVSSEHLPRLISGSALLALELFTIRSYWKGEDWARMVALISSFLIVAREISTSIENGGSLVTLMSHPVRFFEVALALFLLYWLNTPPVRAWFKNAPLTAADLIASSLTGKLCTAVGKSADESNQSWCLTFEHEAELILNCPWRIVMDDNLAYASDLSSNLSINPSPRPEIPVNEELPRQLLQNLRVTAVRVTPRTFDLFVTFEMGLELQTWSADACSEQWRFADPVLTVVADSAGLNSQVIPARIPTEDSAAND